MSKTLKNTLAGFAVAALLLVGAGTAKAATIAELQALIADLTSQLAALSGGSSCNAGTYTHTVTLMQGSMGAQVSAMQKVIGAIPDGNFGPQTKAKVATFQSSKGLTADGVVGPMTGAALHTASMVNCDGDTDTDTDTDNDSGPLSGGAGSVEEYMLISNLQNEEVGEDEEDVAVAGLEITADEGSDIEITAVKLVFDEGTATSDFEDYATEVSIWFDGEEVARMDADEFNDDNDWTRTISLDSGAIIREGDTEELKVGISGTSGLDTNDEADTWTVDFRSVRFEDADGAVISEDPTTATRTFSFESFSDSADVELKISSDDELVNDARIVEVDADQDTDGVEVLSFTLEAEGDSDIELKKFGVNVDVTGASHTDDVLASLTLIIDGEEVATADCFDDADCVDAGADEDYLFDDVDFTIPAGETLDASIEADFFSIADDLDEGDTVAFTLGETETDQTTLVEAEDEAGDELGDSEISGSVTAEASELRSVGIRVTLVDTSTSNAEGNGATDDVGTFVIEYDIEAFGGNVYVSDTDTATIGTSFSTVPSDQVLYTAAVGGTATASGLTGIVDFEENSDVTDNGVTNGVLIKEDKTGHFSLEVTRTNTTTLLGSGSWKVNLMGVSWETTDTATQNVYDFDLSDFETDSLSLN